MTADWTLTGGSVLRDGAMRGEDLHLGGGVVADSAQNPRVFDASGLWLLPGIIDVHGDAIERIVMPRPGVGFPMDLALQEADRQLLANGITTAFHGVTISWEPGLRSLANARDLVEALEKVPLACDTRANLRWETFALDAIDEVIGWFDRFPGCIFSLNDHTTTHLNLPPTSRKIIRMAERNGFSADECVARLAEIATRAPEVPAAVVRMTKAARDAGLPMFAHDENNPAVREHHRALGIRTSEFAMTTDTARSARRSGEHVVFGAPNVLRGGSHNNAVDAGRAIHEGLGTVLASDYYYPSQLRAAFVLADQGLPFAAAWDCVSSAAADGAGLTDRGRLNVGMRGDVIAVCPQTRNVRAVFIAGERKFHLG